MKIKGGCRLIGLAILLMWLGNRAQAQSLGDPIVDITFGSGAANFSGPLLADSGYTTYNYTASSPNDGSYTIANTTKGLNSGWWLTTDHTGNAGGYMMIVNGSKEPGIFYTRTVTGLCANTTYQFAAWIKNLLNYNGILPNVTFSIETPDGDVLGSGKTEDIGTGNSWIQYPFTFTTLANTGSVVIKMINNSKGGAGNDIAIDDITFRAYGAQVSVVFDQSETSQTFCAGTSQTLHINTTTSLVPGYVQKLQELINGVWTDQSVAGTAASFTISSPIAAGTYSYRIVSSLSDNISSPKCIVSSNQLTLNVVTLLSVNFGMPKVCLTDTAAFTDSTTTTNGTKGQFTYAWNFGDPNATATNPNTSALPNPSHRYTTAAVYPVSLTVGTANGCLATVTKNLTVSGEPKAGFTVLNPIECSNREILLTNQSTVAGSITKIEMYYDYGNNPTLAETDNNPYPGKLYHHLYNEFHSPATINYQVRMVAYSGNSCASEMTKTITLLASPHLIFPGLTLCGDAGMVQLSAGEDSGVAGSGIYIGRGVSASGLFNPVAAGIGVDAISYVYTAANACTDTISQNITVNAVPTITMPDNMTVLDGGSAKLQVTAGGDSLTYLWYPSTYLSSAAVLVPVVTPTSDITYTLTVTNKEGCSASGQVIVSVLKTPVIPNTFTPNGDGINDTWKIESLDTYSDCTVEIYNRNGQKVYSSIGYPIPWDGKYHDADLPVGTYYYVINPNHGRKTLSGGVTIIR